MSSDHAAKPNEMTGTEIVTDLKGCSFMSRSISRTTLAEK
jgi:hypothetical protein